MWHTKKTLWWKIICLNEVYKFSLGHFLTRCIFYDSVLKKRYWKSKILRYLGEDTFFLIMSIIRKLQKCIQKIEREDRIARRIGVLKLASEASCTLWECARDREFGLLQSELEFIRIDAPDWSGIIRINLDWFLTVLIKRDTKRFIPLQSGVSIRMNPTSRWSGLKIWFGLIRAPIEFQFETFTREKQYRKKTLLYT